MIVNIVIIFVFIGLVNGCSNIIVSPEASLDGSSMIAYNADSSNLYGSLYHYPASDHSDGEMRQIYNWDSGYYLGEIPEVEHTYNVVGNMNEFGLVIGETTYGGISSLQSQSDALIDYGSLIWITLQRSKTAKEAILLIDELMSTYGYASEGESFSIADDNEAWIMEIIGKGEYELGAVWVARKVPAGYVCAHANQARITTFPLDDPENCLYSSDVITFAKSIGLYPEDSSDSDFSFSDVYDPVTFSGARFCDARVWSFYSTLLGDDWSNQYLDYAQGYNLTNRLPLFVKPNNKISLADMMSYMRNHYENTLLDMSGIEFEDIGAVYSSSPYRAHPLTWTATDPNTLSTREYLNERPIATQQTGWNFISQTRKHLPTELKGLLWFGVDDSATTVRFPIYGSATEIPASFAGSGSQDGVTPPMMTFSVDSAFYVFNLVANWAYSRWDLIYPVVLETILSRESQYRELVAKIDATALAIYNNEGSAKAIQYVTNYSKAIGNDLVKEWFTFFGQLFVGYRDGYVITENTNNPSCGCNSNTGSYPQTWYNKIVEDTGDHYLIPDTKPRNSIHKPINKLDLLKRK